MKKFNFLTLLAALAIFALVGCKKDNPEPEDSLNVEGLWKVDKVNFLDDNAKWDDNVEYTPGSSFGFAPHIYKDMRAFNFKSTDFPGQNAKVFEFISDVNSGEEGVNYWYWKFTEDKKSFEIIQTNKDMPPYDFSLANVRDVVMSEDGNKMTFKADINSRVPGKPLTNVVKAAAELTLTKGAPTKNADVYIKGEKFVLPSASGIDKMKDIHWKLKPGSDLYDPTTEDIENYDKGYMKVVALILESNNELSYRYAFPMGVVSAKQYTQTKLAEEILEIKLGDPNSPYSPTPEKFFQFTVESIDLNAGILKLKVDGIIREFVKINNIADDINKEDYNLITEL